MENRNSLMWAEAPADQLTGGVKVLIKQFAGKERVALKC